MTRSSFLVAIDEGDAAAVATQLAADPALAAVRDDDGVSATMHALYRGRAHLAEAIAAVLPELDVFEAAALGRLARVRELLAADERVAMARAPDGFTALHFPAFFARGEVAAATSRALIEAGADVNARSSNDFGVTPLHSAVASGNDAVVEALLDAGADPNVIQAGGWTPLHGAAANGSLRSVERLLAAGADREARNDAGQSALDLASAGGHEAIVARLLR
ncbi:MAG: uncharacterized protein QOF49_721 [Chloroflexota bacterium]|nr:uncharacterized protein [Chloroflexota bacterium]